jgi:hypothetical protein
VLVRPGEGVFQSDRVVLTWPDNLIQNEWLQVTVLANGTTGLAVPSVFYFGNAIGETGDSDLNARVDANDILQTRNNPHPFFNPADIYCPYDFNRDQRVDAYDLLIVRNNQTTYFNQLNLISITPPVIQAVLVTEIDNTSLDAVEIQNLLEDPADTTGWVVAANNALNGVTGVHSPWYLPSQIAAGQVLYRGDDAGDPAHYWGEDIIWTTRGKGWVMILNAQGHVADFVAWGYSEAEIASLVVDIPGSFQDVAVGSAWSGATVSTHTDEDETLKRGGAQDHDNLSDWSWSKPGSLGTQNSGLTYPFPGGGKSGIEPASVFAFTAGNEETPAGWAAYSVVPTADVQPGESTAGSNRVFKGDQRVDAHDAVFASAARAESAGQPNQPASLQWIHEFDLPDRPADSPKAPSRAQQAVDKLLSG